MTWYFYNSRGAARLSTYVDNTPVGGIVQDVFAASGATLLDQALSAPEGYLLCNGAAVSRSTYSSLFDLIGTTFGVGDGLNTFNLPNYTDVSVIGSSISFPVNSTGGSSTHTHSVPSHSHTVPSHTHPVPSGFTGHIHTVTHHHNIQSHAHPGAPGQTRPAGETGGLDDDIIGGSPATVSAGSVHAHPLIGSTTSNPTSTGDTTANASTQGPTISSIDAISAFPSGPSGPLTTDAASNLPAHIQQNFIIKFRSS